MHFVLVFTDRYRRSETRFLRRHPEIRRQYDETLELLEAKSLRLHLLKGRLTGPHPVSINPSYRITIELLIEGERIPVNVGDHDAVN